MLISALEYVGLKDYSMAWDNFAAACKMKLLQIIEWHLHIIICMQEWLTPMKNIFDNSLFYY